MALTYRLGGWVKADMDAICKAVSKIRTAEVILHPSLVALKQLIEEDPEVNMYFTTMFQQNFDPPQTNPIKDYMDMLRKMQSVITSAPVYGSELGSAPLNHLLIYVMATPSGTVAFINDKVNKCFKDILNSWKKVLDSAASQGVLNTQELTSVPQLENPNKNMKDGWLCPESLNEMPGFLDTFKVDLTDPYYGFKSWNDFFARRLRDDFETVRPIANPDDPYTICSPCDAYPYFIARNVNQRDEFWIKNQPYSIQHMLANDPLMADYVGGTVYQAFLDTANYHRWHSPVDGKITYAYPMEGAYYAEALSMGYDPTANTYSQRYLTHVDTRAIIHIDTGNAKIGKVIFVAVGMAEISSCTINVQVNNLVKKGDELGTFMFGGSTYCLLFKKGVQLSFTADDIPMPTWSETLQKVNSKLGTIMEPAGNVY